LPFTDSEAEGQGDSGDDRHRHAMIGSWSVAPLLHGVKSCLHKKRVAADELQLFDRTGLANESRQPDGPLNPGLFRQLRVDRAHAVDEPLFLYLG
jgi:hypothetical protein